MADGLSDGTISWMGGMDTSRSPTDIGEDQYAKAVNVVIPPSQGGISVRPGFHCCTLKFDSLNTKRIYTKGSFQGEGWFESNGRITLMAVIEGYVLRFTKMRATTYFVENLNPNDRNINRVSQAWVNTIPGGCIVNDGFTYGLYVTESTQRRRNPISQEFGIGQMGVYLQNRYFEVDQSSQRILASDFLQPLKFTREDTNIFGFACPDKDSRITAIGKQKSILSGVEGGNLIFSSTQDIYSVDVRGTRSSWGELSQVVGKTTETVPGFSAVSSYSFEAFNTNIYFRSKQFGISNLKQSQYQYVNLDALANESIEASYFLNQDTDWMLDWCYTRACNSRLLTTVAPQRTQAGAVYWSGILSLNPAAIYNNQGTLPRRFESVFTGVRPWCLTCVKANNEKDQLFVHSHDTDSINRLYVMDEMSDHDINDRGEKVEIQGFIETRAFNFKNPFLFKKIQKRFYRLSKLERSVRMNVFARPDTMGPWENMWDETHLVCRSQIEDGHFVPLSSKPQVRNFVNMNDERYSECYGNKSPISVQYRIEFTGPLNLETIAILATLQNTDQTVFTKETECETLVYDYRPNYYYNVSQTYEQSDSTAASR